MCVFRIRVYVFFVCASFASKNQERMYSHSCSASVCVCVFDEAERTQKNVRHVARQSLACSRVDAAIFSSMRAHRSSHLNANTQPAAFEVLAHSSSHRQDGLAYLRNLHGIMLLVCAHKIDSPPARRGDIVERQSSASILIKFTRHTHTRKPFKRAT